MTCGEKISNLRKAKGMTQEDLGKVLNITYQAVSKWERGESLPDFNTMSQIAKFFQVPLSYFEEGGEINQEKEQAVTSAQTVTSANNNYIGACTVCGKMLKEDDEYVDSPKIVCKSCAEAEAKRKQKEKEEIERQQAHEREKYRRMQLGSGFDFRLGISLVFAVACYVLFTVLIFTYDFKELSIYGFLMPFFSIAVFAIVHSISEFINDLRDVNDDTDGYTKNLSLIVGGIFAAVNIVLYLIFYFTFGNNIFYVIMLIAGAVISFTFVSQFMWGSVIKDIFLCGGFTFKLPGFIFSLTVDSLLWMIVTKIFLGIIAVIVFIVTTVIVAVVAMVGSVFTFIPCVIYKTAKDKAA